MRIDKKVKEAFLTIMHTEGEMTQERAISIIKQLSPVSDLDMNVLIDREYKNTTNRVIASIKGKDRIRACYSTGYSEYVSAETCKNIDKLRAARDKHSKTADGYNAGFRKLTKRIQALAGQVTIDELLEDK